MTFLAPAYFIAACFAAAGVVALHFLVTREPRTSVFPTVRFVPQAQVRSFSLALKLTDIPLLLLRVAIVLLIGAALAQPRIPPISKDVTRIVAVDVSRAVRKDSDWRTLVREHTANADVIVALGATAAEVSPEQLDTMLVNPSTRAESSGDRGSLSAGLVASLRAASRIRDRADSLELVLVSPLVEEERDAATLPIRALWPGGITVVRAAAAQRASASEEAERPKVEWAESAESRLWMERPRVETIGGVRAGDATLIYPFERRWRLKQPLDSSTHVIARWIDGEPAAVQHSAAGAQGGCVRSIGFSLPTVGDTTLRPDFVRFLRRLEDRCGASPDVTPLPPQFVSTLEGTTGLAPSSAVAPPVRQTTPLVPWLLLAALVVLALEYPMRRLSTRRRTAASGSAQEEPAGLKAAA